MTQIAREAAAALAPNPRVCFAGIMALHVQYDLHSALWAHLPKQESEVAMTAKIDGHTPPSKMKHHASPADCSCTVYVLMTICFLLIAITMYLIWQKSTLG